MKRLLAFGTLLVALTVIAPSFVGALSENWPRIYANILKSEGGARYTNHPRDPGGPTKFGITIHDVRLYINPRATAQTVRNLTEGQARVIYEARYWKHPCTRGPELPSGLDYSHADFGVNSGVGRSGKQLRAMLGYSTSSCVITDEMIATLNEMSHTQIIQFIRDYNARRLAFLRRLRTFNTFGRGWTNRVNSVRAISILYATPGRRGAAEEMIPAYGPGRAFDPDDPDNQENPQ